MKVQFSSKALVERGYSYMNIKLSFISFTEQSLVHEGQKSNFIQRLAISQHN